MIKWMGSRREANVSWVASKQRTRNWPCRALRAILVGASASARQAAVRQGETS